MIYRGKTANIVACMAMVLFLLSHCQSAQLPTMPPTQPLEATVTVPSFPTASAEVMVSATPLGTISANKTPPTKVTSDSSVDEPPIIVVGSDQNNGSTTIHLTWLNGRKSGRRVEFESEYPVYASRSMMDDDGIIYVSTQRIGPDFGGNIYMVSEDSVVEEIDLIAERLSFTFYRFHGRTILAGPKTVRILEPGHPTRIINLQIGDGIYGLVGGKEDEAIAFASQPVENEGEQFAEVLIIDLNLNETTERLLPAPQFEEIPEASPSPGVKYGLMFIGVSPDLKKLYYSYQEVKQAGNNVLYTRLGVFDTENREELPYTYDEDCTPMGGYSQYNGYLMASHSPFAGGAAFILRMEDLTPVVDLYEVLKDEETSRLTLHPFGQYFIVGADKKVFLLSETGSLLREYLLPPELIGRDYTIVEYRGDH